MVNRRESVPPQIPTTEVTPPTKKRPGRPRKSDGTSTSPVESRKQKLAGRAVELARWPRFARQILADHFAAALGGLVGKQGGDTDGGSTGTIRSGRTGLRRLLENVLRNTHEELIKHQQASPEQSNEKIKRVLATRRLSANSLPYLLRLLAEEGVLQFHARQDLPLAQKLQQHFQIPVSVYASAVREQWATRAAREFLLAIERVGQHVWKTPRHLAAATPQITEEDKDAPCLNIGIVGGSTVQLVIERLEASHDWDQDFGISPGGWGNIRILALNVCLTRPDELSSNANVLVNTLCRSIQRQISVTKPIKVTGFGLLATLTVSTDTPPTHDEDTKDVLTITDPSLLTDSPGTSASGSKLNLVLTSIGTARDSIFLRYRRGAAQPSPEKNRMVGDLLYSGFDSEGEPVPFSVNGQDVHFFSALSLGTLEELVKASRPDREVLLIARRTDRGFEKHIAIHSALQKHCYASRLILDDVTARALFNRIDAFAN